MCVRGEDVGERPREARGHPADEVKRLGFAHDHLATIVAGEIGMLQAQATAVAVSP
jgi:hypothetical protein